MTTKELFEEYAMIHWKNGLYQLSYTDEEKQRIKKIPEEIEASIRREVVEDLLDKTKGIDDDGNVYNATQLDWLDLEQYALSKGITLK